jgi:uncharacterized protein YhbP (UPF0306 family)
MSGLSQHRGQLNELLTSQQLAVLATHREGQPYSNLVAFAATEDLRHILFVTGKHTSKFENIRKDERVAILIDSRNNKVSDFKDTLALTAIGIARETLGRERDLMSRLYLAKHPHLAEFLNMPDNALMNVTVADYIIAGFDLSERVSIRE